MKGKVVELGRHWRLGAKIGDPSGFGQVYAATAEEGGSVAVVKLVAKQPGAKREMLFVDLTDVPNVIPIIDSGEWRSFYTLVMPRADESLAQHTAKAGGILPVHEAVGVLSDVFETLTALAGRPEPVVHRDIKLENVLLYSGRWCLADFGIARYAEAATSTETFKYAGTREYHPPERWRGERATSPSDVYSTGIMGYRMLSGQFPFRGPDFGEEHQRQEPPPLNGLPPTLATLIAECLFKRPEARPMPANLTQRLSRVLQPTSPAGSRLQQVHETAIAERTAEEGRIAAARSDRERRAGLAKAAETSLAAIGQALRERILQDAPSAGSDARSRTLGWSLGLREATLSMEPALATATGAFGASPPPFEVIAHSSITVRFPADRYQYEGRSHSLWYCDAQQKGVFRWYETAFSLGALVAARSTVDPFSMEPSEDAGRAVRSKGADRYRITRPFESIDQGDEERFIEAWIDRFAAAAEGRLGMVGHSPEIDAEGSFRSS
jgi:serine/threonine-protein kinase